MRTVIECLVILVILNALYLNLTDMGSDNERYELTKIHNSRGWLVKLPGVEE